MSERYLDQAAEFPREMLAHLMSKIKVHHPGLTPIEEGMAYGLLAYSLIGPGIRFATLGAHRPVQDGLQVTIHIQHPVDRFRVDFAVELQATDNGRTLHKWIAVECDGYDFHPLSKEQVTQDKAREREIVAAGFLVLRFSGTEIHRSCLDAAEQVVTICHSTYKSWLAE